MAVPSPVLHGYNTHRPEEIEQMLDAIGVATMEDVFAAIPPALRLNRLLDLPPALSEWELARHMQDLAAQNATTQTHTSFLGGGAYEHYIPAVVDAVVSRGEFLTSYTPYQPEISQGLLQALFEYQRCLALITGLPVVNGSCYDGATALADAAWISCLISGRNEKATLLASAGIWPQYRRVVDTYMQGRSVAVHTQVVDASTGKIDVAALEEALAAHKPAGFLFQSPNALGVVEDVAGIAAACKQQGVVAVCVWNPLVSGMLTPPGAQGVDIVVCDGQVLGIPLSAGGPSLGVFAISQQYRKYVPGRLVGKVHDINGNLAYALVYEDREQHIAREKATSNICSNQALNALRAVVYLASVGEAGLAKIAALNTRKAHYLAEALSGIEGVSLAFSGAFFNEFVIRLPKPVPAILAALQEQRIFAGIDYSGQFGLTHALLVTATEVRTKAEMDHFVQQLTKQLA